MALVGVDLGCGASKQPGFVGLDYIDGPQVDHVLDLTTARYPFEDRSVDAVFSAHFLEHIDKPDHVFNEIGRICKDGASIEIWTPYAFSNEAFLYGHAHYLTEDTWAHFCVKHRDTFADMLGGRWQLNRIVYGILRETVAEIEAAGFSLDFAVKHFKGVVNEFGVEITFREDLGVPVVIPELAYVVDRDGERRSLVSPTRRRRRRGVGR